MSEVDLSMCRGKDPLTPGQARSVARRMRKRGKCVMAFRCWCCGQWHVGNAAGRKKKPIKTRK